ncbi:MAG: hypothetical protein SFY32_03755 [Bacteroidota bacterium]|nr:hypothetical protein [Bacteroidota bacterium]
MSKYNKKLSYGANNTVIALDDYFVAKIYEGDTRSDIGSEAEKMKYANKINDLVVKFERLDYDTTNNWDMLVMERIYPLDFRGIDVEKRQLILSVFIDELKQLHTNGFVHRDICRPSNIPGEKFDNIMLTKEGLRLIDVGISAIKEQVGDKLFEKYVENELAEVKIFEEYFINR